MHLLVSLISINLSLMHAHGTHKADIIYPETLAKIYPCNVAYVFENSFSFYVKRMFKLILILG
jgi:hypothetical protein